MSHFRVAVILADGVKIDDEEVIEALVNASLAPYDENMEVPEYEVKCWCVGRELKSDAIVARDVALKADHGFESFNAVRDFYHDTVLPEAIKNGTMPDVNQYRDADGILNIPDDVYSQIDEARDALWKQFTGRFVETMERAEQAYLNANTHRDVPDPACSECHGTGVAKSTYNPESRWDWWSFGGRWNGQITGNPEDDNRGGFNFEDHYRQLKNNKALCKDVADEFKWPFAVIVPSGEWFERGKMGWFGISGESDKAPVEKEMPAEATEEEWGDWCQRMFERYADNICVALDCHI